MDEMDGSSAADREVTEVTSAPANAGQRTLTRLSPTAPWYPNNLVMNTLSPQERMNRVIINQVGTPEWRIHEHWIWQFTSLELVIETKKRVSKTRFNDLSGFGHTMARYRQLCLYLFQQLLAVKFLCWLNHISRCSHLWLNLESLFIGGMIRIVNIDPLLN